MWVDLSKGETQRVLVSVSICILLVCSPISPFITFTGSAAATASGDLTITDETSPPFSQELEPGEEYTFDVTVDYQLPEDEEGRIELFFADVSNEAHTKTVTGTGEYETTTFTVTQTVPEEEAGDTFYISSILYDSNDEFVEGDDEEWNVDSGENTPPTIDDYSPSTDVLEVTEGEPVDFSADASDPDQQQLTQEWYVKSVDNSQEYQLVDSTTGDSTDYSHTFSDTGDYLVKVEVNDEANAQDEQVWTVSVGKENRNRQPQIERLSPSVSTISLEGGDSETFEVEVSDPDADLETIDWYVDDAHEFTNHLGDGSPQERDWTREFTDGGEYTVVAEVTDSNGNTDSLSWTVDVEAQNQDRSPTIDRQSPSSSSVTLTEGGDETFEVEVSDPDDDLETVEWFLDGAKETTDTIGSTSSQRSSWSHTFANPGEYTIEAKVTDSSGNTDSLSWDVSIDPEEVDGDVTITDGTDPPFGRELEPGEEYTFDVEVDYRLTTNAEGRIELFFADVSDEAYTKTVTGTGEYETTTFTVTATVPEEEAGDTFYISSILYDSNDEFVEGDEEEWNVDSGENTPPTLDEYSPSTDVLEVTQGETVDFSADASDPDEQQLTHEWYVKDVDVSDEFELVDTTTGESSDYSHTFGDSGDYLVKVEVNDEANAQDEQVWTISVGKENQNRQPQIERLSPSESSVRVDEGSPETFEVEVSDPDADLETIDWYVDGDHKFTNHLGDGSPQERDWTREFTGGGEHTVVAEVTDSNGNTDSLSWTVNVGSAIDLEVVDVETRPETPTGSDTVEFRVKARNTGEEIAESVEVRVFVDGALVHVPPTIDLEPGQERFTVWSGNTKFDVGTHTAVAVVDPDNNIPEIDEDNNEIERTFTVTEATGTLRGTVTDSTGTPVKDADISLEDGEKVLTDGDGRYSFAEVPPGDHTIEISADGFGSTTRTVTVAAGETMTRNVQIDAETYAVTLDSEPVSVELEGGGEYEAGSEIVVSAPEEREGYQFSRWESADGEQISDKAVYEISEIKQDYDLTAVYESVGEVDMIVEDIEVRPQNPTTDDELEVRVTIANTGTVPAAETEGEVRFDGDIVGTFAIGELAGGEEVITSWTEVGTFTGGGYTIEAIVDIYGDIEESNEDNNRYEETVTIATATGTVHGTVTNSDGDPVEGATVTLDGITETATGPTGGYSFDGISVGDHTIEVAAEGFERAAETVAVESNSRNKQNFRLDPVATPTLTPTTVGTPTPSATVRGRVSNEVSGIVVSIAGRQTETLADGDFRYSTGFEPGEYVVEYTHDGETHVEEVTLEAGRNTLELEVPESLGRRVALTKLKDILVEGDLTESEKERVRDVSTKLTPDANGFVFGDLGQKYPDVIQDTGTVSYFGGWMVGVMTPGVDVITDSRDCAVWIKGGTVQAAADTVDCGGAVVNAVGTAAAWTGVGAGAATVEELTDLTSVSAKFISKNPGKISEIGSKLKQVSGAETAQKVINRLEDISSGTKAKLREAIKRSSVPDSTLARVNDQLETKLWEPLTKKDVAWSVVNKQGDKSRTIWLISTQKWTDDVVDSPGHRHIIARHFHPEHAVDVGTKPASKATAKEATTHIWPKHLTSDEITDLIKTAAREGDPNSGRIIYNVDSSQNSGIDEVVVYYAEDGGHIISAFPRGPGVKKADEVCKEYAC